MDIGWKLLWGIIGISLLVTIHEFGHYWVARKLGFKVLRFSVGFGKPLWKRVGRAPDHIEYVIAAIPLGGYVRMLDERDGVVPPQDVERSFTRKPPWQRILVLLAGPAANILFAIVVLWLMFWAKGVDQIKPVTGEVMLGKPAAEAGLRPRDLILSVNGHAVADPRQLTLRLFDAVSGDGPVVMRVRGENGGERQVTMPLADPDERYRLTKRDQLMAGLGFEFWRPTVPPRLYAMVAGGAADKAGLKPGDLVLSLDGHAIREFTEMRDYVTTRPGREILVEVRRGGEQFTHRVVPDRVLEEGKEVGRIGITGPDEQTLVALVPADYRVRASLGPLSSLAMGANEAWQMTAAQAKFFWRMLTRRVSPDNMSSLITIADVAGQAASAGPGTFLTLLVLLSLSLGFLNLLPIPILDGGQIVFQVAEWIRGRPLSERVYILGQQAGLLAIVLLMGVALFNDLSTYLFSAAK